MYNKKIKKNFTFKKISKKKNLKKLVIFALYGK